MRPLAQHQQRRGEGFMIFMPLWVMHLTISPLVLRHFAIVGVARFGFCYFRVFAAHTNNQVARARNVVGVR